jgi:hypothetical protein
MSGFGYNVLGFGANASGSSAPSDDQFNRVSFLSHFDGANNGVNDAFDDSSSNNHTISNYGSPTQGSFGPFARPDGEWGVNLGSSINTLRAVGAGDISGDFTVETWVFMNKDNGNYIHLTYNVGGLVNVFNVYNGSVQNFLFGTSSTGGQTTLEFNDTTWDAGVWTHLAMVRSSGTLKIYVNGVADATTTTAVSGNLTDLEYIGTGRSFTSDARIFDGKVSNVRFSSTARYTSNFTPPTAPFTTDSDTNLLTCQSNRFVDNSSNGHTITPAGSAAVTAFGPFLTSAVYDPAVNGASAYMDGSGDTLRATWTAADIINQNFTLEYWLYFQETSGYGTVSIGANDNSASYVHLSYASNGQVFSDDGQNSGSGPATSAGAISPNSWNHLALVRVSNDMFIYINGAKIATKAITASLFQGQSGEFGIGYIANPLEGYICDARIVTSAVYTGDTYTVPTAPLTAVTNTKLLLNMADGQAIDSAAQAEWTGTTVANGTPKLQTGEKKIGTSSLYFDGSSNYYFPNGFLPGGTGDFTIEFWFRASNTNNNATILTAGGIYFQFYNNQLWYFPYNGSAKITSSTISTDTWYHVAGVRSGTTFYLFLDGTSQGTLTSVTSAVSTGAGYFGMNGIYPYTGYIDEMRISRMARYTSNFTAPTEPFADKGQ